MDERWSLEAPPVTPDRHSWMLSDLLNFLTIIMEQLSTDVRNRSIHYLDRAQLVQLAVQAADAYGKLLHTHELQIELDRSRSQLAALQAQWDEAKRERGWE